MAYTTINKSTAYFDTKLYSGNGGTQTITGLGHQPDLTWVKSRNTTDGHSLQDSVRGYGSTTKLASYDNSGENNPSGGSYGNYGYQSAATSDGFTMVAGSTPGQNNKSGNNYVAWNWKANGSSTTTNNDGATTSYISHNSTGKFSIIKYTGTGSDTNIGHGLGGTPDWFITKALSASDWHVWCNNFPAQKRIKLNSTGGWNTNSSIFASLPDATKIYFGGGGDVNGSGVNYICYAWKNVTGFSKAGVYDGNSGNNGTAPFVYTGFKPKFLIIRNVSQTSAWQTYDAERLGYNDKNYELRPNETAGEGSTTDYVDFLSNGFKLRHQSTGVNQNGDEFIYLAFGQTLVGSNNVPCTAR